MRFYMKGTRKSSLFSVLTKNSIFATLDYYLTKLVYMKKISFLAALLFAASFAFAQVTTATIGQGTYTDWSGNASTAYGIDFNNDGILEISIKDGYDFNGNACGKSSLEYSDSKIQLVIDGDSWDVLRLLNAGDVINSSTPTGGYGDGYIDDINAVSTTASYVGFKYTVAGQSFYSFAKIHREGNNVVWDKVYYNATPNAAITVGANVGIQDRNMENASTTRKVVINGVVYIERDGKLYDFSGRRVK